MTAIDRIAYIQALFQRANTTELTDPALEALFFDVQPEFASVVYEAVAAHHAKNDFEKGLLYVPNWLHFKEKYHAKHGSQIHVGLGWAIAECSLLTCSIFSSLPSEFQWRVWDGFGYYSGLFKRRETVRQQNYPLNFNSEWSSAFDQGLGRCFWYLSQANAARTASMVHLFQQERHSDLWRGIGLAMSYVGGVDTFVVHELLQKAGVHQSSVRCGALIAMEGKEKAGIVPQHFKDLRAQLQLPENPSWLEDFDYRKVLLDMELKLTLTDV
ncbi:MAG: hypothetical protein A3D92_00280 [Bacteroidetes bacterium RIFCSPHIGHO2_02_FULL_44_7]|nr:MAG: hypothetical protein A3D92_00280 [Bacteroidetes bacterium RIFCSPHIGHO2_02_FULL_44_7]